jgi:hypothetical protein
MKKLIVVMLVVFAWSAKARVNVSGTAYNVLVTGSSVSWSCKQSLNVCHSIDVDSSGHITVTIYGMVYPGNTYTEIVDGDVLNCTLTQ